MKKYDYLVVGAGLFGCVFAYNMNKLGKTVLVIDKKSHIGGACYTDKLMTNIDVHMYGAHIFHTSNKIVWKFITSFDKFIPYVHTPMARDEDDRVYNLPFNMNTFNQMWGIFEPDVAQDKIHSQSDVSSNPSNLEEQCISMVGRDIYNKLVKGYTEKQWGRSCSELPPSIIKRLPVRFTFNNNYFNDIYQGIPEHGYTYILNKMLENVDVKLDADYSDRYKKMAKKVIYTGSIDELFMYKYGRLNYRTLRFENLFLNTPNYQGVSVMNYTGLNVPYTRIIEHKHFNDRGSNYTIITKEYPLEYTGKEEPYYPIDDFINQELYNKYHSELPKDIIVGGRLGDYKYYDMDKVIEKALELVKKEKEKC